MQRSVCMSALKSHLGTITRGIYSFRVVLIRSRMSGSNLRKGADLRSESSTLYRSLKWNKILSVIKVFLINHLHLITNCNGTIYKNHVNLMLKIRPLFISWGMMVCLQKNVHDWSERPTDAGGWIEGGQPRYLITRNMKTQVSSMPPIMMNLSWVARLSISLITVFDSPNMLATSSIFLWVPCVEPEQSSVSAALIAALTCTLFWENSGITWQQCNYPH